MKIRLATSRDIGLISNHERWISRDVVEKKIEDKQIYMITEGEDFVGWLRYGYFWDNVPFMIMLHLKEEYRGRGYGSKLVAFWEEAMRNKGYKIVLTSTSVSETAQHFYQKLGYKAVGGFTLGREPMEILLSKEII